MKHIFTLLLLTLTLFGNIPPQITYNDQHQPLVVEYADGSVITYTYDEAGNITHIVRYRDIGVSRYLKIP